MVSYDDIVRVNGSIRTTDVKGKAYAEVNQRIKAFRMLYPEGTIHTELISDDGARCIFKAVVMNGELVLGTGTAFEKADSSFINKTSYIENCETSAVGRALGMCGLGIDTSIASAEEVGNAINNQNKPAPADVVEEADLRSKILGYVNRHNMSKENIDKICNRYKVKSLADMSVDHCKHYISVLEKNGGNINE